ncbi:NUDIX domain-containing protein [Macrococcoides goetzii]|uniref:NUDIX domain-containing protein n=1 Tax=Macrococcoides goetzii TaxID=1891097 RepID=A0A2G5NSN7_9STAP|nr:NUDIX domain-containing protein [Macrococcus goetzii]RAI82670.1 NUDIX domain-containing protein [Macrococcus goetzii]
MKIFGEKIENLNYKNIPSVYAVILNNAKEKVLTVRNGKGHYFLPGGGIENNESDQECLERELLEETGYSVSIGNYIGNAKQYLMSSKNEPILNDGNFYICILLEKINNQSEEDHEVVWLKIDEFEHLLFHDHHIWAVNESLYR